MCLFSLTWFDILFMFHFSSSSSSSSAVLLNWSILHRLYEKKEQKERTTYKWFLEPSPTLEMIQSIFFFVSLSFDERQQEIKTNSCYTWVFDHFDFKSIFYETCALICFILQMKCAHKSHGISLIVVLFLTINASNHRIEILHAN